MSRADLWASLHLLLCCRRILRYPCGDGFGEKYISILSRLNWCGSQRKRRAEREQTIRLIMEMAALINYPANLEQAGSLFNIDDGFIGQGYGIPTDECLQAMILLAQTEGIITDLVYSAKALSALIDHVKAVGTVKMNLSFLYIREGCLLTSVIHQSY